MTGRFLSVPRFRTARRWAAALLATVVATPVLAANISLGGSLARDDSVEFLTLMLSGAGFVNVTGIGYAGGTDFAGNPVAPGGFDTVIYLFSSSGDLLYQSDDGVGVPTDPATGEALDSAFTTGVLAAGDYTLALAQADNYLLGFNLADGFAQAGNGNFTAGFGCTNASFCDYQGNNRTASWTLNVSGDTLAAVVPEPGSLALVLAAGAMVAMRRARRTGRAPAQRPGFVAA